jgi:hypothetical protein
MPLKNLSCDFKAERDTEILRSIRTLEKINDKPAAEFWKDVADKPTFPPLDEAWAKKVRDLPAEKQVEEITAELKSSNPGFDGKMTPTVENGVVTGLEFVVDEVTDISPVRALAGLNLLSCHGSSADRGKLADLSPLRGMQLKSLSFWWTKAADVSPLKGMPLTVLNCGGDVSDLSPLSDLPLTSLSCGGAHLSDLSPLKKMPLNHLQITNSPIVDLSALKGLPLSELDCSYMPLADLSPLKGMSLTQLGCHDTAVGDLSPLKDMPLTSLRLQHTAVSDLSPLKDMKLTYLDCGETQISDLSFLKNMPLKYLRCDFKLERDGAILRSIKILEEINGKPAAEFWKEVEANKSAEKKP